MRLLYPWLTLIFCCVCISSCCLNCPNPPKADSEPAYAPAALDPPPSGEMVDGVRIIKINAQKYEFTPSTIVVNKGDKVRLEITSKDVKHGFGLKEYNINEHIEPGKTAAAEFNADQTGTFKFHCTVFCGMGHLGMKGKLIVQ